MPLKILSATLAERALPQYSDLLAALTQQNSAKAKSFYCNDTRLYDFFFNDSAFKMPTELQSVLLQLILVLSHGQTSVKREFNVKKTVLKVTESEKRCVMQVDNRPHAEEQPAAFYHRTHKQIQINKICKSCPPTKPIRP